MGSKIMTADGDVVASGSGIKMLKSFSVHHAGATAGDKFVLRDGGATGEIKAYLVATAANGNDEVTIPAPGIAFGSGIYYSEQVTASGKTRALITWE